MGRSHDANLLGAPAICNLCNRRCQGLHQAGGICYWCREGRFVHREFWKRGTCLCKGDDYHCPYCFGSGDTYTPREGVTDDELRAWSESVGREWP
jgi:hypothetical protein